MTDKNILIIGAARSGKTTLAKRFSKEKGYNLISIDDIVSGLEAYPELKIRHGGDAAETAAGLAPFLIRYFTELSEGNTFTTGSNPSSRERTSISNRSSLFCKAGNTAANTKSSV